MGRASVRPAPVSNAPAAAAAAAAAAARAAAMESPEEVLSFLHSLPLLSASDKRGLLQFMATAAAQDELVASSTFSDVSIHRRVPASSNGIYRVTGVGEVAEAPQVVFELLCNPELMPEWDMLVKGASYLSSAVDEAGRCQVATLRVVYGLPGLSHLVSDRDFILRVVRVSLPSGLAVLYCRSVSDAERVPGDPGPTPRMIRGHMWASGYVVIPTPAGCLLNITLQVDPKGWIPTAVVNLSLESIPLNIQRIRAALTRLHPALLSQLRALNMRAAAACTKHGTAQQRTRTRQLQGGAGGSASSACSAVSGGSEEGDEEGDASGWFDAASVAESLPAA